MDSWPPARRFAWQSIITWTARIIWSARHWTFVPIYDDCSMIGDTEARQSLRSSPYWPIVSHPVLRRILPALAVSAIGDGMALVAVTWMTLQLVQGAPGPWVGVALAAYTAPSALGTLLFGRFLRRRDSMTLGSWDAILRTTALAAIPVVFAVGLLTIQLYVALLALSSLLHAWGSSGRYTLIAQLLPERHHLAANAVLSTLTEFATIVGPALAGLIVLWGGAATVLAVDAATFAILAVTYRLAIRRRRTIDATAPPEGAQAQEASAGALAEIRRNRPVLGVLLLTFGFFVFFGPVLVALPIYVVVDNQGSAFVLSAYYTTFGIGAVAGGLATGYLRRLPLTASLVAMVLGFGVTLLPLGVGAPLGLCLAAFGIAGLFWPPFTSFSMALLQRGAAKEALPSVLAANGVIGVVAVPLGTIPGGLLVGLMGARQTLLLSAVLTLALAGAAVLVLAVQLARRRPRPALTDP
ncbi:MFS transporter [Nonomuraea sp. NPDC002799]